MCWIGEDWKRRLIYDIVLECMNYSFRRASHEIYLDNIYLLSSAVQENKEYSLRYNRKLLSSWQHNER